MIRTVQSDGEETPVVTDLEMALLTARREWNELAARASKKLEAGQSGGWYRYAAAAMNLGDGARAESLARAELNRQEGYARAYAAHNIALAALCQGRFLEGLAMEEETIRLQPLPTWNPAMFYSIRAQIYVLIGHPEEAIAEARAALVSDPYYWRARYWLATALLAAGDRSEAEAAAAESRSALAETRGPTAEFWDLLLSAEIALAQNRPETASDALDAIAGVSPAYRDRQMEEEMLARASVASGDTTAAIAAYRRIIAPPISATRT